MDKHLRRKRTLFKNLALVAIGYQVPFLTLVFAKIAGLEYYSWNKVLGWAAWVLVSWVVAVILIKTKQSISFYFIRTMNAAFYFNWYLLWLWTISFLENIRLASLLVAFQVFAFLFVASGFLFSMVLVVTTFFGYLIISYTHVESFSDPAFTKDIFYACIYFAVTFFLSILAGYLARQRRDLKKAKKDAEAAFLAKSEFLGTMSHEIRTPLNAIIGMNDLIIQTDLKTEQRENFEVIQNSAQVLLRQLDDILDFSKLESGKIMIVEETINVQKEINNLGQIFEMQFHQKGQFFRTTIGDQVPVMVSLDWAKIRQILMNLLNNALKFTEKGGVDLYLDIAKKEPLSLVFEVKDTGIGISKQKVDMIFEEFTQVDTSTTRRYGGTGLGLSIAKKYIDLLGGTVWVESQEGEGASFFFTTPIKKMDAIASKPVSASVDMNLIKELNVLVADDNKLNQKLITKMLLKAVKKVTIAENGEEVITKLKEGTFDVILMDIQMPVKDGIQATKEIRSSSELGKKAQIPIIALTANAFQTDKQLCIEAGMNGFQTKPIQLEKVLEEISNHLELGSKN